MAKKKIVKKKVAKKTIKKKVAKKATKKKVAKKATKKKVAKKATKKKVAKKATKKKVAKKATKKKVEKKSIKENSKAKEQADKKVETKPKPVVNYDPELELLKEVEPDEKEKVSSTDLVKEYNPDDELDEANFGYGWSYEESLDSPEKAEKEEEVFDEDAEYATSGKPVGFDLD